MDKHKHLYQIVCQHCRRPILGEYIQGSQGPYHIECTHGESWDQYYHLPKSNNNAKLDKIIELLEKIKRKIYD